MQLNRTNSTFEDIMEFFLPISLFRLYRSIKKAYKTSKLFANLLIVTLFRLVMQENKVNDLFSEVWRKRNADKESKEAEETVCSIRPFKIHVQDSVLVDLKSRLERTRSSIPLGNTKCCNGVNREDLKKLIDFWKSGYDWRKHELEFNQSQHFKTKIENVDVHFVHIKTNRQQDSKTNVIPLLLIHNWPGSFADFQKIIPIFRSSYREYGLVFDVVCPSIPGCGFSDSSAQTDFSARSLSRILVTLMDRLGYTEFYVHGNGWGAITASLLARYYPYRVKGMHVNMCFALPNLFDSFIRSLVVSVCPIFVNSAEYNIIFPLKQRVRMLFEETGLIHMQCTKPDTLGCVFADSPTALAAYILERFQFKKTSDCLQLPGSELKGKFSSDDLLTMVTMLWINNNFTSGARFFKESINDVLQRTHDKLPLIVPCGVAFFPDEIFMLPKYIMDNMVENLVSYTVMPRGGHFAAFEEPQLLAEDICKFIRLVENGTFIK